MSFFVIVAAASAVALILSLMSAKVNPNPSSKLLREHRAQELPLLKIMLVLSVIGGLVAAALG